jgi:hypothetical protein
MKNISKTFVLILFSFFFSLASNAQAPHKMSYQAVVRNASNALVANAPVGIKISILQGSTVGTIVFSENHTVTTNGNGLATLEIGLGTITSGSLTISWENGPYFIKTEIDPAGGTAYSIFATSQLSSVPYALHAETANSALNTWGLTGNSVTASNYIGTTNNTDLIFRRASVFAGLLGNKNTSYGVLALSSNPTGLQNVALGYSSLGMNGSGGLNTGLGDNSLANNTFGDSNVAAGNKSLYSNINGSFNSALGVESLRTLTSGSNNIGIGNLANVPNPTGDNQLSIGNVIYGTDMGNATNGKIGIGVTVPTEKLEVAGKTKTTNLQITAGAGANKVLTSDATGNATWQTTSSNANTGIHITKGTAQNIPSGVDTKIDFAIENTDDANAFNTTTDEWTIPSTGFYHIYATMRFSPFPLNQFVEIVIYVNGTATKFNNHYISNDANFDVSADLKLNANDKVSIYVYQSTGAVQSLISAPITNYFTGYKIY